MNIYSSFQSFSFFISSNFNFPIHPNIFVCVYHCQEYVCNHSFHPFPSTICLNFCPGYYLNVIFRSTFVRVFGVKSKINRIKCPEFNFYVNKLPLSLSFPLLHCRSVFIFVQMEPSAVFVFVLCQCSVVVPNFIVTRSEKPHIRYKPFIVVTSA